jgi:site-specific recombinase XerD
VLDDYLDGRTSGPIFVTSSDRRIDQPEARRTVQRIARRACLDGPGELTTNSLRVAFITGAREAGVPLEDIQDAAGHADPRDDAALRPRPPLARPARDLRSDGVACQ